MHLWEKGVGVRFVERSIIEIMVIESEELDFVLGAAFTYIDELIILVLEDDKDNPEHSAVYVSNLIKWYIKVMKDLGHPTEFNSVQEYFKLWWEEDDYREFEKIRKKESEYYIGKQY